MDIRLIKMTVQRFLENLIICVVISAVFSFLFVAEIMTKANAIIILSIIGVVLHIAVNVMMLRGCYYTLKNDKQYFLVNIIAYIVFVLVTLLFYWLASVKCYTWLFAITKFARYIYEDASVLTSMLIFHAIELVVIFIAPAGMSWVFRDLMTFEDEE